MIAASLPLPEGRQIILSKSKEIYRVLKPGRLHPVISILPGILGQLFRKSCKPGIFAQVIKKYLKPTDKILDMDTGGGEFLLSLRHPYELTSTTEGMHRVRPCVVKPLLLSELTSGT